MIKDNKDNKGKDTKGKNDDGLVRLLVVGIAIHYPNPKFLQLCESSVQYIEHVHTWASSTLEHIILCTISYFL